MKKIILLSLFASLTFMSEAQFLRGTKTDSVTVMDNIKIKVGDKIQIGQGSSPERNFRYIYNFNSQGAPNGISSKTYIVKKLKYEEDKKTDTKQYFAFIQLEGLMGGSFAINLENAIRYKEIISLNKISFDNENKSNQTQNKVSIVDELKKLKELLDQGVITQDEFNAQKKKILGS